MHGILTLITLYVRSSLFDIDEKVAIGIDLGMVYSKVAIWNQNHIEVISNDKGIHATPNLIAFSETGRLFGQEA